MGILVLLVCEVTTPFRALILAAYPHLPASHKDCSAESCGELTRDMIFAADGRRVHFGARGFKAHLERPFNNGPVRHAIFVEKQE